MFTHKSRKRRERETGVGGDSEAKFTMIFPFFLCCCVELYILASHLTQTRDRGRGTLVLMSPFVTVVEGSSEANGNNKEEEDLFLDDPIVKWMTRWMLSKPRA